MDSETPQNLPPKPINRVSSAVGLNALAMAFGTLTSRSLGLVREIAFAAFFSRTVTDAWTTAFRLPNLFRRLLGEGSLSISFVPVFVDQLVHDPTQTRAKEFSSAFFTLLLVILTVLTTLGTLFAENILQLLLDENYALVPGKMALTVRLAQIMFCFIFFMSAYAYLMAILNALGKFAWAAMAPTFFNLAMIISTFLPHSFGWPEGETLAWGVVAGGFLQMFVLIPSLWKKRFMPRISFRWSQAGVGTVLRNMLPGMLGMGLLQITTLVNLRFASVLGEGPISYIYWADRLLELPLSLVSVSLGAALLPTLSGMWSRGERTHMTETANFYLRLNLFVSIPAAMGLFMLAKPIVELLFLRGKFTEFDLIATASVVKVYSLILISSSCVRVLVPSYYAIKNTWLPALVSGVCLAVHIGFAPFLMDHYGLTGLVFSSFVSSFLNMFLLLACYRKFIGAFGLPRVLGQTAKFLVVSGFMGLALLAYPFLRVVLGDSFASKLICLGVTILLGVAVLLGSSRVLRLEEFQTVFGSLLRKLKRRLGR